MLHVNHACAHPRQPREKGRHRRRARHDTRRTDTAAASPPCPRITAPPPRAATCPASPCSCIATTCRHHFRSRIRNHATPRAPQPRRTRAFHTLVLAIAHARHTDSHRAAPRSPIAIARHIHNCTAAVSPHHVRFCPCHQHDCDHASIARSRMPRSHMVTRYLYPCRYASGDTLHHVPEGYRRTPEQPHTKRGQPNTDTSEHENRIARHRRTNVSRETFVCKTTAHPKHTDKRASGSTRSRIATTCPSSPRRRHARGRIARSASSRTCAPQLGRTPPQGGWTLPDACCLSEGERQVEAG